MIRKLSFFANSKSLRVVRGLLVLLVVVSVALGSRAASVPQWLAAAQQIDLGQFGTGNAAVVVGQWTDFRVDAAGKFVWTERRALRVLDVRAAEPYLSVLGFENTDEKVVSMQAWSVSRSGRVVEADRKSIATASSYPSFVLYSDDRTKILRIPGVEQGSLVGYEIVRTGWLPLSGTRFRMEGSLPVRLSELRLSVPAGSLRWFVNHPDRAEVVSQSPTEALFRSMNRPALPREAGAPPFDSVVAVVFVNYDAKGANAVQSWEDAGRAIHPLLSAAGKPAPDVGRHVEELSAGRTEQLAKVDALYTFVSQQVRYVAIEIGIGGFVPHAAADVFRNRYGDCKDKATLLLTMLNGIGLRGYPALIGTRGAIEANPQIPTLATFNHMIVALPIPADLEPLVHDFSSYDAERKILWMDPTSDIDPLGQLPAMDQGVYALITYPDRGELRRTPEMDAENNGVRYRAELQLAPDGTGTATVQQIYRGAADARRHSAYRNLSQVQIRRNFDERVARYANQAVFRQFNVSGIEDTTAPIVEDFSFTGSFVSASTGDSWFFQPIFLAGMTLPEISARPRILPLDLGIPDHVRGEHRVALPIGMTVVDIPEDRSLESEFGRLDLEYSVEGNVVVAKEALSFTASRIAPEKYGAFREFINGVRRAQQVRLRAVRMSSPF